MKKTFFGIVIYTLISLNQAWAADKQHVDGVVSEEWVVVLDDPRPKRLQGWQRTGYRGGSNYRSAVELTRFGGRLAKDHNLALKDQWLIESLGVYCLIVSFNGDQNKTIEALEKVKGVQWVQPSNDFRLLSASTESVDESSGIVTKDGVLNTTITGKGVTIAIIDSAVDSMHLDLAPAVELSEDFVVSGVGFDDSALTGEAHGTAIAGVMVAQQGSKLGIAGVAPQAKLLAYRGCWENSDGQTNCNTLSLARALDAVVRSGADILNLSLSGPKDFLLDRLIDRVIANGTVVVTAFDPARARQPRFPSNRDGVLVVRAEKLDSQFGDFFTAPGARVVATPGNGYNFMKGHSVASAYTSGLLALRKQYYDNVLGDGKGKMPIDWREYSKAGRATDLMQQLIEQSPQTSRAVLTSSQFMVTSS